jgi:CAAX protease family protein
MALIQPLKRHPLLTYFVLVYVLAWAFWIPLALLGPFSYAAMYNPLLHPVAFGLAISAGCTPSLLGILLTGLFSGKSGLLELFGRLGRVRVPLRWYAVVLLLLPALWLIALGIPALLGLATITFTWSTFTALGNIPVAGFGEELGWRGFALPRLQARRPALSASLLLGVLWGLWHLPWRIALGLPVTATGLVQFIICYPLMLTAWTVLFTWVYNNTRGSLFLMVLFHAFANISLNTFWSPGTLLGNVNGFNGIVFILYVMLLWVAVLLVVVLAGPARLSRSSSSAPAWDGESLFENR